MARSIALPGSEPGYIATRWRRSMKGGFYGAFCHSKDKHLSTKCPMLTELGLKLIEVGGSSSGGSKAGGGAPPAGGTAGTPGAKVATATEESPAAPAGMTASLVVDEDESSTDSFRWFGDEDGVTFEEAVKTHFGACVLHKTQKNALRASVYLLFVVMGRICVTKLVFLV